MKNNYLYCIFFIFICTQYTHAQSLTTARQKGVFAYLFKISNEQAEKLIKTDEDDYADIKEQDLHILIDSFPADSVYRKPLRLGHYLEVRTDKNSLSFKLISVNNTDIEILNNDRDFSILVLDSVGKAVKRRGIN